MRKALPGEMSVGSGMENPRWRCNPCFRFTASRCAVWLCGENCGLDPFPMGDGCV